MLWLAAYGAELLEFHDKGDDIGDGEDREWVRY